jgi:serine/threonine-protein kinase
MRLASFLFIVSMVEWLLSANHLPDPGDEFNQLLDGSAAAVFRGLMWAAFYLAIESYVRKNWPEQIVTWSRLLAGQVRDPLVGRDILIGGVFAVGLIITSSAEVIGAWIRGTPIAMLDLSDFSSGALLGGSRMLAEALGGVSHSIINAFFFMLALLILRLLLRSRKAAAIAFAIILSVGVFLISPADQKLLGALQGAALALLFSVTLLRYGLLPFMVGFFYVGGLNNFATTFDTGAWQSTSTYFALTVILAVAAYGLHTALTGRSRWETGSIRR